MGAGGHSRHTCLASATLTRETAAAMTASLSTRSLIGLIAAPIAFLAPLLLDVPGLDEPGERALAIMLLAVVLWVTEVVPLHATAAVIIIGQITMISDAALVDLPADFEPAPFADYYQALADPVLMLFLGGFFLADGAAKFSLDRALAGTLLRPFGTRPAGVFLGIMLITAVLSMFMSNTAVAAMMVAIVLAVTADLDATDPRRIGLALSIPVAANVGGMGTPVGTPPNAIALSGLLDIGEAITFIGWMIRVFPFMLLVLAFGWLVITQLYRGNNSPISVAIDTAFDRSGHAKIFYVTFAATVLLWLTEPLHGVSSTIIGFVPVVVLLSTGVFTADDLRNVRWNVLWLIAGGIALGKGVGGTGLDEWLVGLVAWQVLPLVLLLVIMTLVAISLSSVISNTATANLLVPIGLSLATSGAIEASPVLVGLVIATACSLAMVLPVSTPPNAIAYATGMLPTGKLAVMGLLIGGAGLLVFGLLAPWVWQTLGLVP